jgi:hypothetical protein
MKTILGRAGFEPGEVSRGLPKIVASNKTDTMTRRPPKPNHYLREPKKRDTPSLFLESLLGVPWLKNV